MKIGGQPGNIGSVLILLNTLSRSSYPVFKGVPLRGGTEKSTLFLRVFIPRKEEDYEEYPFIKRIF